MRSSSLARRIERTSQTVQSQPNTCACSITITSTSRSRSKSRLMPNKKKRPAFLLRIAGRLIGRSLRTQLTFGLANEAGLNDATLAVQVSAWINNWCWWSRSCIARSCRSSNWSSRTTAAAAASGWSRTTAIASQCIAATLLLEQQSKKLWSLYSASATAIARWCSDFASAAWSCAATTAACRSSDFATAARICTASAHFATARWVSDFAAAAWSNIAAASATNAGQLALDFLEQVYQWLLAWFAARINATGWFAAVASIDFTSAAWISSTTAVARSSNFASAAWVSGTATGARSSNFATARRICSCRVAAACITAAATSAQHSVEQTLSKTLATEASAEDQRSN